MRSLVSDKIRAVKEYAEKNGISSEVIEGIENILMSLLATENPDEKEEPVQDNETQAVNPDEVPNAA